MRRLFCVQCGSVFHAFLCRCKRRDVRKRHGSCSRENSVLLLCFLLGMELVGSKLVGARGEEEQMEAVCPRLFITAGRRASCMLTSVLTLSKICSRTHCLF
jgi:hypothetical protein